MNTIMTIAHNANNIALQGQASEKEIAIEPKVRLIYDLHNTELHLLKGVSPKLEVVHDAYATDIHMRPAEILHAQRNIHDAVRAYEDRIQKRSPLQIV